MAYHSNVAYARQYGLINENTVRFFKIAYPLVKVNVDIHTVTDNREFHLIESYINNLVAGKASGMPDMPKTDWPISLVYDKDEALRLLGLDYELYDVASYFFEDLLNQNKIIETDMGLFPEGHVPTHAKLIRQQRVSQKPTCIVVDPFDGKICHKNVLSRKPRKIEAINQKSNNRTCIAYPPTYVSDLKTFERIINEKNFDFSRAHESSYTQQLADQNLPEGSRGIEIIDNRIEVLYIECFLAVDQTQDDIVLKLYNKSNGKPFPEIDVNDDYHDAFKYIIDGLSDYSRKGKLYLKCTPDININLLMDNGQLADNVSVTPHGCYEVEPSDETLMEIATDLNIAALEVLPLIEEGYPFVISDFESGKLVYFILTEEQKQLCRDIMAIRNQINERCHTNVSNHDITKKHLETISILQEMEQEYSQENQQSQLATTIQQMLQELQNKLNHLKQDEQHEQDDISTDEFDDDLWLAEVEEFDPDYQE